MERSLFDIGIIGAGSWGTAIASLLAHNGHRITLWVYEDEVCKHIANHRENHVYLPGIPIPDLVMPTQSFSEASTNKDLIVSAVPSQLVRQIIIKCVPSIDNRTTIVSLSKGIENETLKFMSGIFEEMLPNKLYSQTAFLSGPSFAKEVAQHLPTAVVVASINQKIAEKVQQVFSAPFFRVYT
ncbi:MAG: NAD(P)-binding domain-containing protein, partial [Proteobacteria bacterium]|nr:NAD(P)-binding domain-containing protein [Pseudomonadota bacterium]